MLGYRPRFTGVMQAHSPKLMNQNLVDAVIMAIAKQKGLDASGIGLNSSLPELGVNSLDAISIVYDIEDRFNIEVPNAMLADLTSVRDIVDKLSTLITVPA